MRRAYGHNPCCNNQSSNIVLRDDSVTTGGAQPCHDVETLQLPDQTFITSTQSTLSNGTFFFYGEAEGALRCAGQAGRLTAEQVTWDLFFV